MPEVGRFASPDTIVPDPTNPQSYNRYSYVRNNPVNLTDPTGHRECAAICDGEVPSWDTYQDAAWEGSWDIEQQATNSVRAENVVEALKGVVGFLWEPADWAFAFSDGFQWYDSIGMLPVIPAALGSHANDVIPIAQRAVGRSGGLYDKVDAQGLYVLLDDIGDVRYVGRGDAPRRIAFHSSDPILGQFEQLIVANNNLSYDEARGLEQLIIDHSGGIDSLVNRINGIAMQNPRFNEYLAAGRSLLREALDIIGAGQR